MTKRRGGIPAGDLFADPEYQAAIKEQDARLRERERFFDKIEAPLVGDLLQAGIQVRSVWDLVNTNEPYPEAVPVLMEHLGRDYHDRVMEGIIRTLAVPETAQYWPVFKERYEREADPLLKDAFAMALANTTSPDRLAGLLELIADDRHGECRLLLLIGLKRLARKHQQAREALLALHDDPVLGNEARRLTEELAQDIRAMTTHRHVETIAEPS